MFNISFDNNLKRPSPSGFAGPGKWAQIVIGDYRESIYIPTAFWSVEDYQQHWSECSDLLYTKKRAVFITSIVTQLENEQILRCWPVVIDSKLFAQEWAVETIDYSPSLNLCSLTERLLPYEKSAVNLFAFGSVFKSDYQ